VQTNHISKHVPKHPRPSSSVLPIHSYLCSADRDDWSWQCMGIRLRRGSRWFYCFSAGHHSLQYVPLMESCCTEKLLTRIAVEVLKSNRPPSHKLLWCLIVFLFPILGLVVYWLFSNRESHNSGSGSYEAIP
jgi:hypothetical protein